MKKSFWLILILILAAFLRFYQLNQNPPSLNWDEISHGYNAYSILKTGKDEWGIKFPLIFRAYGDFKLPLYIYLTVPFVAIFGLNSYSVRAVSVLSGLGLVFAAYLITKKLTKNNFFANLSAFLVGVSPWSLFVSRVAVEANLGAFLFAMGMYFLICWLENYEIKKLLLVALFWGLSLHSYNSARILIPIFSLAVFLIVIKTRKLAQLILFVIVLLLFFIPVFFQYFDRSAKARFEWVTLIDQGVINEIEQKRLTSNLPKVFVPLLFNKATFFAYYALENYFKNLSPRYLFFRGGSHYQFSLPNHELLYLVTAPFLILGLVKAIFKGRTPEKLIGFWLLASFIPSVITKDAPHVLRSILILPSPMILSAIGLEVLVNFLKEKSKFGGKLLRSVLVLTVLVSFGRWWQDYQNIYPKAYSWAWQYGYKEAVQFIKENYPQYERIYFSKRYGEPHEFILFYFPWDPASYQKDEAKIWDYHANWYWVDKFDKFEFVNDWEVMDNLKFNPPTGGENLKILLITSPNNYPEGWKKIKTINFLDGKPAFEILEK